MKGMTDFLKKLWGFVRPYRGRFFLGLLCGIGYGLVNGLLLGAVKVVVQLVLKVQPICTSSSRTRPGGFIHSRTRWLRWFRNFMRPPRMIPSAGC